MQMQTETQLEIIHQKTQVQQEIKNVKYLIWLEMKVNGLQSTALTRLMVVFDIVLIEEANTHFPPAVRVAATATLRLAVPTATPLDPYFT